MTSLLAVAEMVGIAAGGLLSVYLDEKDKMVSAAWASGFVMAACMMILAAVPYLNDSVKLICLFAALVLMGMAGGVYVIPLEAFIQVRPAADRKGATIAAANFAAFSGILLSGPTLNLFDSLAIKPSNDFAIMGVMTLAMAGFLFLRKRTTND